MKTTMEFLVYGETKTGKSWSNSNGESKSLTADEVSNTNWSDGLIFSSDGELFIYDDKLMNIRHMGTDKEVRLRDYKYRKFKIGLRG